LTGKRIDLFIDLSISVHQKIYYNFEE